MPGVVDRLADQRLGQLRYRRAALLGGDQALAVFGQDRPVLQGEVILHVWWVIHALAAHEAFDLAFVFLEQADGVVLRVALEKNHAEPVLAHGQVHAGDFALHQHVQAGGLELFARDVVVA